MVEIVPATPELLRSFYGEPQPTTRALVAVMDGRPICVAGVVTENGVRKAYANISDEMRKYPKTGLRMARRVMQMISESGVTTFAKASPDVEAAERFLEHLGFKHLHSGVYKWPA